MRGIGQSATPKIARSRHARGDRHRLTLRDIVRVDSLDAHAIAEALREGAPSLPPYASLAEAAACMLERGIPRALVVEDGKVLGIVTPTDVGCAVPQAAPSHDKSSQTPCPSAPQSASDPAHWVPGAGEFPSAFFFPWLP